jgi:hypothetical protein
MMQSHAELMRCHPRSLASAVRYYARLQQDEATWAYNRQSAARLVAEALQDAPMLRRLMRCMETSPTLGTSHDLARILSRSDTNISTLLRYLMDKGLLLRIPLSCPEGGMAYGYTLSNMGHDVMAAFVFIEHDSHGEGIR